MEKEVRKERTRRFLRVGNGHHCSIVVKFTGAQQAVSSMGNVRMYIKGSKHRFIFNMMILIRLAL